MVAMPRIDLNVVMAWIAMLALVLLGRALVSWLVYRAGYRRGGRTDPHPVRRTPASVVPFRQRRADLPTSAADMDPAPVAASSRSVASPDH